MRRIRALRGRLIIKRDTEVEQARSGLWLPSSARERPQMGRVVASSASSDLQPGTSVIFPKYSDKEYIIDGEAVELLRETEAVAEVRRPKEGK